MATTLQIFLAPLLDDTNIRISDRTGVSPGVVDGYPRNINLYDTIEVSVVPLSGGTYVWGGTIFQFQGATGGEVPLIEFEDASTGLTLADVARGGWWAVSYTVDLRTTSGGEPTDTYESSDTILYDSAERCAAISCYVDGLGTDCGCGCDGKELTAFKIIGHLQMSRDLMAQGNAPAARQAYQQAYTLSQTCDCNC